MLLQKVSEINHLQEKNHKFQSDNVDVRKHLNEHIQILNDTMKKHKLVEEEMGSLLTVIRTLQTENKCNATDASYTFCIMKVILIWVIINLPR